jgi:hypothetical protein
MAFITKLKILYADIIAALGFTPEQWDGTAEIKASDLALQATSTAIKVKTDSLTFTTAGMVDVNIQYVNDVQVKGTGQEIDPWNPV